MAFKRPKDLKAFRQEIREFVLGELEPISKEIDEKHYFPRDEITKKLQERGLFSLMAPVEWGGMGLNHTEYIPLYEEMAAAHGAVVMMIHQQNHNWIQILNYGNEAQKKRWLPRLCSGEAFRSVCWTEPNPGGAGVDIKSTAVRKGDKYIVNGEKVWATSSDRGEPLMVVAWTDKTKGADGISQLIVGSYKDGWPAGLTMENMPPMMGGHEYYHGHVTYKNVELPVENLLGGREGTGHELNLVFIYGARVRIASRMLGISQRLLDLSVDFAKKRITFGKPIATRQAIQGMLADMATDVCSLRALIMDTAYKVDKGKATAAECSMCKLMATEVVRRVSDNAILVHGGMGYCNAYPVERLYRDARSAWFEEGTPSIHRLTIARELLK